MEGLLNKVKDGLPDVLKFSKFRQAPPVYEEIVEPRESLKIEERWEIARDEFEYDSRLDGGCLLGNGATGYVFKGIWHHFDVETPVAIKVVDRLQHYNSLKLEFPVWKSLNYPFILPLLGVCVTDSHYYLLSPLCAGNLGRFIHQMTEETKIEVAYQIAHGMRYLHSKGILHRDLKTQNILYCEDGTIKICDFGVSKHLMSATNSDAGTYGFMPMEAIMGKWDKASDVFSYGMVLYHIFTGELPYANMMNVQILHDMMRGGINRPDPGTRVRPEVSQMIKMCWDNDLTRRPTFEDCCWRLNDLLENMFKQKVTDDISELKDGTADLVNAVEQVQVDTVEMKEDLEEVKLDIDELAIASQAHSDVLLRHEEEIQEQSEQIRQTVYQVRELTQTLSAQVEDLERKNIGPEEPQDQPDTSAQDDIQKQLNELRDQLMASQSREEQMKSKLNKLEEIQDEIQREKRRSLSATHAPGDIILEAAPDDTPEAAPEADESNLVQQDVLEQIEGSGETQPQPQLQPHPHPGSREAPPTAPLPPIPPQNRQQIKPQIRPQIKPKILIPRHSYTEAEESSSLTPTSPYKERHYIQPRAIGRIIVPKRVLSDPARQPPPRQQPPRQPQVIYQSHRQVEVEGEQDDLENAAPAVGESPVIKTETEGSVLSWMVKFETLDGEAKRAEEILLKNKKAAQGPNSMPYKSGRPKNKVSRALSVSSPRAIASHGSPQRSVSPSRQTWKCTCRWENDKNRTICKMCYNPKPRMSVDNQGSGAGIRCAQCKGDLIQGQKFCKICGNKLTPETIETTCTYKPSSLPLHRRPTQGHRKPPPVKKGLPRTQTPVSPVVRRGGRRRANSGFQKQAHGRRKSAASQFWEELQRSKSPPAAGYKGGRKCRCGCLAFVKDAYRPRCRDCGHKH